MDLAKQIAENMLSRKKKEKVLRDISYPEVTIKNVPVVLDEMCEVKYLLSGKVFDRIFNLRVSNASGEQLEEIDYADHVLFNKNEDGE